MTIKTLTQLNTDFADNDNWDVTPTLIRDLLDSLVGVGGIMSVRNTFIAPTTAWAPFIWFTDSDDTKGVTEDFASGHYTVQAGADGIYAVDVSIGVNSLVAGWLEIAVVKNGALTKFRKKRTMTAGGDGDFGIVGGMQLAEGDTIGIALRANGTPPVDTVTAVDAQFRVLRG